MGIGVKVADVGSDEKTWVSSNKRGLVWWRQFHIVLIQATSLSWSRSKCLHTNSAAFQNLSWIKTETNTHLIGKNNYQ